MDKITTLQGLNLLSSTSVTKINVKYSQEIENILKLIASFHPIFIKDYKFEKDTLLIYSNLTFLWREIASVLLSLDKGDLQYEEAKKKIVEEIIKERISSMSTIPLLEAALKMGYEVTPTLISDERAEYSKGFNRHYTIGAGKGSEIIYSVSSSRDSKIAKEIQRDKWSSNLMIQRLGLPIPRWQVIDSVSDIKKIWSKFEKPVVIKPTGLTGGKGVSTGINTLEQAKKAFDWAYKSTDKHEGSPWQRKIMIQEQVSGEDYRLLIVDGKLEIATKRIPAFIVGDGVNTIEELINKTNSDPKRDVMNPSHTLKPIKIDKPLLDFLKEQGLTLKYVPQKDERVVVRKVASMSQGGITEDYTDKVCPEIKHMVESIAQSIHAFVIGADVLCKDISKPLTKDNGGILEINTMPEAYLNLFPVIGESRQYVAETFVEKLLKNNHTKKIVAIGQFSQDLPTLLKQKTIFGSYIGESSTIGEYQEGEIRINGLDINKDVPKLEAIYGLKINASLDAIIINHRDVKDVEEYGFGFDRVDLLITNRKNRSDKAFMKTIRKYKWKGYINKIKYID